MTFLESPRFPTHINYGLTGGPQYKTHIIEKNSGWENTNSVWPQGRHAYDVVYAVKDQRAIEALLAFFHAVKGRALGFRFKDWADFKSCGVTQTVSFLDQPLLGATDGSNRTFQLAKTYAADAQHTTRVIKKPIVDSVRIGISGHPSTLFTVDYTSGLVTLSANLTNTMTHIAQSYPCVVTANNTLKAGESVYLAGIVGMTALNHQRYKIITRTATTLTLDADSRSFKRYENGGVYHTLPQAGETVTAGFEFDVPVRFVNDELSISIDNFHTRTIHNLALIEIRV